MLSGFAFAAAPQISPQAREASRQPTSHDALFDINFLLFVYLYGLPSLKFALSFLLTLLLNRGYIEKKGQEIPNLIQTAYGMILFETTTSIFELMWDIALVLFIVRISFIYFLLTFLSGCAIAYFRIVTFQSVFILTQPEPEYFTLPIWLAFIILWARYVTVDYEVPRVKGFRLAIGLLALVFLVSVELAGGALLYEWGYLPWIWEINLKVAGARVVFLVLYALMPVLFMGIEHKPNELGETAHGHENKTLLDVV